MSQGKDQFTHGRLGPYPVTLPPSTEGLCSRCSQIDFKSVFDIDAASLPFRGKAVVEIETDIFFENCILCKLLASGPDNDICSADRKFCIRAYDSMLLAGIDRRANFASAAHSVMVLFEPAPWIEDYEKDFFRPSPDMTTFLSGSIFYLPVKNHFSGRRYHVMGNLVASEPNYSLLRNHIEECCNHHKDCSPKRPLLRIKEQGLKLKLVDCCNGEVVDWNSETEYFALSYVWGEQAQSYIGNLLTSITSSSEQLYKDAVKVVPSLGGRWLWIDKLCIDQTSKEDIWKHLKHMDLIFEGAKTVIVAATLSSVYEGLHGVSRPRVPQLFAKLPSGDIICSTLPHLSRILSQSPWCRRAWTYQEGILSRRCLIFSESQAYFVCKANIYAEALEYSEAAKLLSKSDGGFLTPALIQPESTQLLADSHTGIQHHKNRNGELVAFGSHVTSYTMRTLSYDSDIVNAFLGILSRAPVCSFMGGPIVMPTGQCRSATKSALDLAFAIGLCWRTHRGELDYNSAQKRSDESSSWSWTSLKGVIRWGADALCSSTGEPNSPDRWEYKDLGGMLFPDPKECMTQAMFMLQSGVGKILHLKDLIEASDEKFLNTQDHRLVIEGLTTKIKFEWRIDAWHASLDLAEGHDLPVHYFLDVNDYWKRIRRMAYNTRAPTEQEWLAIHLVSMTSRPKNISSLLRSQYHAFLILEVKVDQHGTSNCTPARRVGFCFHSRFTNPESAFGVNVSAKKLEEYGIIRRRFILE